MSRNLLSPDLYDLCAAVSNYTGPDPDPADDFKVKPLHLGEVRYMVVGLATWAQRPPACQNTARASRVDLGAVVRSTPSDGGFVIVAVRRALGVGSTATGVYMFDWSEVYFPGEDGTALRVQPHKARAV